MLQRTARIRKLSAFTLLELLVVMVILAIIAAVVIPSASSARVMAAISAARILATDLEYAQNIAVTYQDPVTVSFNTGNESYTLSNASGPLIHPMNKGDFNIAFASKKGFEDLDIVSANFSGGSTVTFDELGSPDNAGAVIVQVGPHAYRINVAAAIGRVTVSNIGN